ncbi:hypothetical protein [Ancylobacter mangrovi]|uniref:hypothetical protein n=1 Tax=Ancylobacter mangrovi TaxID=2972472 RepID=UPI0021627BD5|nr:hypothetical protein [Ancylobacter mangrovi]MCS0501237.1 hypothetical protein [Ancylobacter mangrovi]
MANASRKHIGVGNSGKKTGGGAMTDLPRDALPENAPLSNRATKRHPEERGLDSKAVQTDQFKDHSANRRDV